MTRRPAAALAVVCALTVSASSARKDRPGVPPPAPRAQISSAETAQARRWLRGMSLRDIAAQLVIVRSFGEAPPRTSKDFREFVRFIRDLRVGGIIVVNRVTAAGVRPAEPHAMAAFLNRMQKLAKVPLIVGADFERGASMRVANTIKYPHLMAYGAANDPALTRALGLATAREARALGVHWVFAPDSDVNNNPDNPIINTRSFGENPELVAAHVHAFIEGAQSERAGRVLVTAKHFPGHGDTNVDSHMNMPAIPADRSRLDRLELVPFRAAIAAGVDSVMTAHVSVPAIEKNDLPATVSPAVLTGLLRDELAFKGLIVTDAMDMQGLTNQFPGGEAAVRALQAGADVLLMPPDPEEAINAVAAAVRDGRLTRKRLEQSALRLLAAKARVGLHRRKLVDLEQISDVLESDEAEAKAMEAAARALTLVKDARGLLPLKDPASTCVFILTESRGGQQGRRLADDLKKRQVRTMLLDPLMPEAELHQAAGTAGGCRQLVIAAFVSSAAYRGNVALPGAFNGFVQELVKRSPPVALVAFGSPYLLRSFPEVDAYLAAFSTAQTSEAAVAKALLGDSPITGRLPISIPSLAKAGDGIRR